MSQRINPVTRRRLATLKAKEHLKSTAELPLPGGRAAPEWPDAEAILQEPPKLQGEVQAKIVSSPPCPYWGTADGLCAAEAL